MAGSTEKAWTNPPCPLVPQKRTPSALQMLAIARAMAALCALTRHVCAARSDTPDSFTPSDAARMAAGLP
ncbi:hypothetical protein ALDI51_43200 [Alicycliphilus denitrificans]|nr:hypothetical protein ALDI51_43200 [Alicycliphilus denitrificans]